MKLLQQWLTSKAKGLREYDDEKDDVVLFLFCCESFREELLIAHCCWLTALDGSPSKSREHLGQTRFSTMGFSLRNSLGRVSSFFRAKIPVLTEGVVIRN